MKKIAFLTLFSFITVIFLSGFKQHLFSGRQEASQQPADNTQLTLEKMNCKPGMYKTYQDFLDQKPSPWTWQNWDVGFTANNQFAKFLVVFKDENGQKVKLDPAEFWGFRKEDGPLYRNGQFVSGKITALPFLVKYVATDYILYNPLENLNMGKVEINPKRWCSVDLTSPVMQKPGFLQKHSNTSCDKTEKQFGDCIKRSRTAFQSKQWDDCLRNIPGVICVFTGHSYEK